MDLALSCSIVVFSPIWVFWETLCAQQGYTTIRLRVPGGPSQHQGVPDSASLVTSCQAVPFHFSGFMKLPCKLWCSVISMQVCCQASNYKPLSAWGLPLLLQRSWLLPNFSFIKLALTKLETGSSEASFWWGFILGSVFVPFSPVLAKSCWISLVNIPHPHKKCKNTNSKGYRYPYAYCIIYSSQTMEATQVSIDWWIDKGDVMCVCTMYIVYIQCIYTQYT